MSADASATDVSVVADWAGNYTVEQSCDGAANPDYTMKVRSGTEDTSRLYLDNLGNYGKKVAGIVRNDSLIIPPTEANVGLMGSVQLSGTGVQQDEELLINLVVEVPGPQGTTTTSTCQLRGRRAASNP